MANMICKQICSANSTTVDSFGATSEEQNHFDKAMKLLKEYAQKLDESDPWDKIEKESLKSLLATYDLS
jgi:hypothetical protein